MRSKKNKKIAIIMNVPSMRNPMLLLYLNSLKNDYDITVSSPDKFYDSIKFKEVVFLNSGNFYKYFLKVVLYWPTRFFHKASLFFSNKRSRKPIHDFFATVYFLQEELCNNLGHFIRLVTNGKFSLVLVIDAGGMTAARWYKYFSKSPYAYLLYEIYPDQFTDYGKLFKRIRKGIERKGCKKMDALLVPTEDIVATFIRRRYKLKNIYKVFTISVCPDLPKIQSNSVVKYPVKFYYHGIFMKDRGLESLIKVFTNIDPSKGQLILRGFGVLEGEIKSLIRENNLQDRISLLPPVPSVELATVAANYDIGLTMSTNATLNGRFVIGFKTLENIAGGLAIIGPESYPIDKFIKRNKVGLTFSFMNFEQSLSACLQNALLDIELIQSWKKNAREISKKEYNFSYQKELIKKAVKELIQPYYFNGK